MKLQKHVGATSEIWQVFIQDSSSTVGAGLAGLTNASGSLTAYYHRDTDTTATVINLVSMTVGTFTSSGFKEIDSANMPGWYQFCPPNTALASGAKSCAFHLKGATNMAPLPIEVQLVAYDPDNATTLGLTNLTTPLTAAQIATGVWQDATGSDFTTASSIGKSLYTSGVVPGGSGGLLISGSNTGTVTLSDGLVINRSTAGANAVVLTGNGSGAGLALNGGASGNGLNATGQSGFFITSNATNGNAISLSGAGTGDGINAIGGATGRGAHFIGGATSGAGLRSEGTAGNAVGFEIIGQGTGAGLSATGGGHGILATGGSGGATNDGIKAVAGTAGVDIRGNVTGNLTGNVTGSVNSVTGAVGSVTGNVGGNVVGSVASVTGSVNSVTSGVSLASSGLDLVVVSDLAGVPTATAKLVDAIAFLFMGLKNLRTTTATQDKISGAAGGTIGTATVSDDGTTFTKTIYS